MLRTCSEVRRKAEQNTGQFTACCSNIRMFKAHAVLCRSMSIFASEVTGPHEDTGRRGSHKAATPNEAMESAKIIFSVPVSLMTWESA